jgi:hypothetical protein
LVAELEGEGGGEVERFGSLCSSRLFAFVFLVVVSICNTVLLLSFVLSSSARKEAAIHFIESREEKGEETRDPMRVGTETRQWVW